MNRMWRSLLGLFQKDTLYAQAIEECHETAEHLGLLLRVSLALLGRLPERVPPPGDHAAAEKAVAVFSEATRKRVLTHIASSGPGHLVSGMVILTTVIDLEKLIENVRQIRGLASARPGPLTFGDLDEEVAEIETRTLTLFTDMQKAIRGGDVQFSRDVMARHKGGLSKACDTLTGRLLAGNCTDVPPGDAAAGPLYIVSLKRVGLHCRNLVTNVANPYSRIGSREATHQ